jgi:hypothetical protein
MEMAGCKGEMSRVFLLPVQKFMKTPQIIGLGT